MAKYKMKGAGSTTGAVSGKRFIWKDGDEIETDEGDFKHLGGGDCQLVGAKAPVTEQPTGVYETRAEVAQKPKRRPSKKSTT